MWFALTGLHALELAKTVWNLICTMGADLSESETDVLERQTKAFLDIAESVLRNFGLEGDDGGPLEEVAVLSNLLSGAAA